MELAVTVRELFRAQDLGSTWGLGRLGSWTEGCDLGFRVEKAPWSMKQPLGAERCFRFMVMRCWY